MRDYDLTKQVYVVFFYRMLFGCPLCRASLEGPAFPSGSQVRLRSCSGICNGKYSTSVSNNIHKIAV